VGTIKVVGLGALNMDYLYRVGRILDDGEAVVNESVLFPGGSAANTVYGLARLGVKSCFIGAVGDDNDGKLLLQDLAKVGVNISQVSVKGQGRTGSVLCLSDSSGNRSLYVLPGANSLLTTDDLNLSYINQAPMLHVSSFADDRQFMVLLELMGRLESSVRLSFAPGTLYAAKGSATLTPILNRTHTLFVNQSEIQQLTGHKDIAAGAKSCLEHGCEIVVVTLGGGMKLELGEEADRKITDAVCYIRNASNECIVEPSGQNVVSQVDTTGAGDAFATGFLYGLLQEKGLEECGRLGGLMAQFSITRMGARQGLPTVNELSLRYKELYNKKL